MKRWKLIGVILTVLLLLLSAAGCGANQKTAEDGAIATAEVVRGDILVDITAAGNLALSQIEDLVFEISGTTQEPLTVSEVLVEEGDTVVAGQVLLTLDVIAVEAKIKTRQESLKTAELNLRSAEYDLNKTISDAADNVRNAEIDLEKKLDTHRKLIYPYNYNTFILDIPESSAEIKQAQQTLNQVIKDLGLAQPSSETVDFAVDSTEHSTEAYKINTETYAEILDNLSVALDSLASAVTTLDPGTGTGIVEANALSVNEYWALKTAEQNLEQSRISLDKVIIAAETSVEKSRISYERTLLAYQQAEDSLTEAQAELDQIEIVAPFDGFLTQLNVEGGDEVTKGTVAAQVADPTRFETRVLVSEMDIAQLREGGTALVVVDSLTGVTLPASITQISPRASIQSGVVNYVVTVEISSTEIALPERQTPAEGRPQLEPGVIPERLQQAIDSGQMTREQAEAMMQRIAEDGGQAGGGLIGGGGFRQDSGQTASRPQMSLADIQLRQGLSVTITLVVEQASDVLLVPNAAISYRSPQALVKVMTESGDTDEREVSVGISNWTDTVVTDGLVEGELVVVSQGSGSSAAAAGDRQGSSFGSMGRILR